MLTVVLHPQLNWKSIGLRNRRLQVRTLLGAPFFVQSEVYSFCFVIAVRFESERLRSNEKCLEQYFESKERRMRRRAFEPYQVYHYCILLGWWNGRHVRLRCVCLTVWGFKSPLEHHINNSIKFLHKSLITKKIISILK